MKRLIDANELFEALYNAEDPTGAPAFSVGDIEVLREIIGESKIIDAGDAPATETATNSHVEVSAIDLREGIKWRDITFGLLDNEPMVVQGEGAEAEMLSIPSEPVCDILNGAIRRGEKITWPAGHRLASPETDPDNDTI